MLRFIKRDKQKGTPVRAPPVSSYGDDELEDLMDDEDVSSDEDENAYAV